MHEISVLMIMYSGYDVRESWTSKSKFLEIFKFSMKHFPVHMMKNHTSYINGLYLSEPGLDLSWQGREVPNDMHVHVMHNLVSAHNDCLSSSGRLNKPSSIKIC